jgi:amidase
VLDPVRPDVATLSAFECACQVAWVARTAGSLQQGDLEPRTLEEATRGRALTHRDAALAAERVRAAVAPLRSWWDDHDVLVTPVMARPPWPLGERTGPDHTGPFCAPASFTGQPAVAVPIHRTADGLPVGVQLIGTPGADETLLNLACALQEAGALA